MDRASHTSSDDEASRESGYESKSDVNGDQDNFRTPTPVNAIVSENVTNTLLDDLANSDPVEQMSIGAKVLERHEELHSNIEHMLLAGFNTIKDPSHETAILFVCGIFAGGIVNAYIAAFGLFYGLSILQPRYFKIIKAFIILVLFVDSLSTEAFGVMTCAQLGISLKHVFSCDSVSPYLAAELTLCSVSAITSSFSTATLITLLHIYGAYNEIVLASYLHKKNILA